MMGLPKLSQPIYTLTIPTLNKVVKFRPFTVKEEKLLMMVKEKPDHKSIAEVYTQIVNNCILDKLDVMNLAAVDLEWIFLQIRSKSVNNIAEVDIVDEDGKKYPVEINLDEVQVKNLGAVDPKIQLTEKVGVIMRYPSFASLVKMTDVQSNKMAPIIIRECIEKIWDEESVYPTKDFSDAEIDEFIEQFTPIEVAKIERFFSNLPYLSATVTFTRKGGEKVSREIRGLESFF